MTNTDRKVLIVLIILTVFLFLGHLLYNWTVAYRLFEMSGGVSVSSSGWTYYGGIDHAWTTPLYIPGCLIFDLDQKLHGLHPVIQPYGVIGILLIFCASIVSSWAMASVLLAAVLRKKQLLGIYFYRLILAVAGWAWVYVPIEWTWVYQWTMIY